MSCQEIHVNDLCAMAIKFRTVLSAELIFFLIESIIPFFFSSAYDKYGPNLGL